MRRLGLIANIVALLLMLCSPAAIGWPSAASRASVAPATDTTIAPSTVTPPAAPTAVAATGTATKAPAITAPATTGPTKAPATGPTTTALTTTAPTTTAPAATAIDAQPDPLAIRPFYVEPRTWAAWAVLTSPSSAADVGVLARTPQAQWFGDWTPTSTVAQQVRSYVTAASAARSMPVLVLYAIPFRDCGGFAAGGFSTSGQYSAWIHQVAVGISTRPAAVVLEPDALAGEDCLDSAARSTRNAMLKNAVKQLAANAATSVYIDGGHSRWLSAAELASRLTAVGVSSVRGFSLNVSNFYTTGEQIAYGEAVSKLLGGAHYVIDTSRNGLGPAPASALDWCNPTGRAVGALPTGRTGGAHADAYLWIKHPGESDGQCERGEPVSGTWFSSYAIALVQHARKAGILPR